MNSDFDKEVDRLLRGHSQKAARRGGSASPAAEDASIERGNGHETTEETASELALSPHLDADELSAYAENALPPSTRTRYATHLADCDRCRRIATSIALASGVAVELERRDAATTKAEVSQSASPSWGAWLGALLSPRVVRFAAPVLALAVVGVVAFVALRQSRDAAPFVALRNETGQTAPASEPSNAQPGEDASKETTVAGDANTTTATTTGAVSKMSEPADAKEKSATTREGIADVTDALGEPAPPAALSSGVAPPMSKAGPPPTLPTDERKADTVIVTNDAPAVPTESQRAAQSDVYKQNTVNRDDDPSRNYAGAANTINLNRSGASGRKMAGGSGEQQQQYPVQERQMNNARQQTRSETRKDDRRDHLEESSRAGERESRQREQPKASEDSARRAPRVAALKAESDKPQPETRKVAGRSFRKQDGAWVDTKYRAGQAVTVISRNSERFRALVADEPELEKIARQLGGEVIVVWKGRIYRIR